MGACWSAEVPVVEAVAVPSPPALPRITKTIHVQKLSKGTNDLYDRLSGFFERNDLIPSFIGLPSDGVKKPENGQLFLRYNILSGHVIDSLSIMYCSKKQGRFYRVWTSKLDSYEGGKNVFSFYEKVKMDKIEHYIRTIDKEEGTEEEEETEAVVEKV